MAEKRANGEGSKPRQRSDGRWEAKYTDGDGERRSVYGKTRKQVAESLIAALSKKDEPKPFVPTTITLRAFFEQYDEVARETMKRRSYETYRGIAANHLLPTLGSTKLKNVSREQVQRLYSSKRESGLSPARIRRIHGVLSSALNTAVRWQMLEHNVCKARTIKHRTLSSGLNSAFPLVKRILGVAGTRSDTRLIVARNRRTYVQVSGYNSLRLRATRLGIRRSARTKKASSASKVIDEQLLYNSHE